MHVSDSSSLEVRQLITYFMIRLFFFSLYFWSWYQNIYFFDIFDIFDFFDILSFSSLWFHIEEAALLLSVWLTEIISIKLTYLDFLYLSSSSTFKTLNILTSPLCHSRSAKHLWPDPSMKEIIFQVPFSSTCSLRKVSEGIASFYRSAQPSPYLFHIWPLLYLTHSWNFIFKIFAFWLSHQSLSALQNWNQ